MLNLRALKQLAARILPEAVKGPLRGRLYGYRPARLPLESRVVEARDGVTTLSVDGILLRVPADGVTDVMYHLETNGESVAEMHAFLRVSRQARGVLWDVGAHRGIFSVLHCLAHPENTAVAWEPAGSTARIAREIAALNGLGDRMTVRQMAVGDDRVTRSGSVDALGFIRIGEGEGAEEVAFTTLDHETGELGDGPRVLKIDVEGHEGAVLRGARDVLRRWRPALFLELHLDILERQGDSIAGVVDEVLGAGYAVETFTGRPLSRAQLVGLPHALARVLARVPAR